MEILLTTLVCILVGILLANLAERWHATDHDADDDDVAWD